MNPVIRIFITAWQLGMAIAAVLGVGLGLLSFAKPRQSIQLYQVIMVWFNWRVVPINEAKELRNTRVLGAILVFLSLVDAWLLTK